MTCHPKNRWTGKTQEATTIIPDVCEVLESLFVSMDLDQNAIRIREHYLTELIKLVKETKRISSQRREVQNSRVPYYATTSYVDDRMDNQRAAVILISYVAEMIASIATKSDACRCYLKQLKWSWLVQASDVNSFESYMGGNEQCSVREVEHGREVRNLLMAATALGQLPRPTLTPSLTLSFHVDEAGSQEANGLYRFDGFFPPGASETVDTVTPKFARIDPGTRKRFTIFRCSATDSQLWYISELSDKPGTTSDVDYYQSKDSGSGLPDGRWVTCSQGIKPAPKHLIPHRVIPNPEDDLLQYYESLS